MFSKIILVAGHPRSGTHLVIDTLRFNLKKSDFPILRPSFSTLENLILPHDTQIVESWLSWLKNCEEKKIIPIVKTHCIPSDLESYINIMSHKKEAYIIKRIMDEAKLIYIRREPVAALKSWYEYAKGGGVVQANSSHKRLAEVTFSEFLDIENLYKLPFRNWSEIDTNVISFISYHHLLWEKYVKKKNGIYLNFNDFRDDFAKQSKLLFEYLYNNADLKLNNNSLCTSYRNPFSKEEQNNFYKLRLRVKNKMIRIMSKFFPNISKIFLTKTRVPPTNKLNIKVNKEDIRKIHHNYDKYSNAIKKSLGITL